MRGQQAKDLASVMSRTPAAAGLDVSFVSPGNANVHRRVLVRRTGCERMPDTARALSVRRGTLNETAILHGRRARMGRRSPVDDERGAFDLWQVLPEVHQPLVRRRRTAHTGSIRPATWKPARFSLPR